MLSPQLLSDFYKADIRPISNETINKDSFLLRATTKPVDNKNPADNKNLAFLSNFLSAEILLCTTPRNPADIIQLVRKCDEFCGTSTPEQSFRLIGRTMNPSQSE